MIWVMNLVAMIIGYASIGVVIAFSLGALYLWLVGKTEVRRRNKAQDSMPRGGYVTIRGTSLINDKPSELKIPTHVLKGCAESNEGLLRHSAHRYGKRPELHLVPGGGQSHE